jgi:protein N-lysine methyltransferase METTL21D
VLATDIPEVIYTVLRQNITQNMVALPAICGHIEIRELDWTVAPDRWTWDNDTAIASSSGSASGAPSRDSKELLRPPFDLIISSDTLYSPDLTRPLLRTLHALSTKSQSPPIYLCIERRDPLLVDNTLAQAKDVWGFNVERVSHRKLVKAMDKSGVKWVKDDWDGVEIWKLVLARARNDIRVDGN